MTYSPHHVKLLKFVQMRSVYDAKAVSPPHAALDVFWFMVSSRQPNSKQIKSEQPLQNMSSENDCVKYNNRSLFYLINCDDILDKHQTKFCELLEQNRVFDESEESIQDRGG